MTQTSEGQPSQSALEETARRPRTTFLAVALLCFLACALIVAYGLYLIVIK